MSPTLRTAPATPGAGTWGHLVLAEARLVWRDTAGVLLPLALPLLILLMNSLGAEQEPLPDSGGLSVLDAYMVPLTLLMILAMVGMINLPSHLATYRSTKVLRRLAVAPAHPAMVLVAQVVVNVALAAAGVTIGLAVAFTALGVTVPARPGAALGVLVLAAAAMYGVGLLIAAMAPSANAAIAVGLLAFLGSMALGGGFAPRENLPDALALVGEYTPFGAAHEALSAAWIGNAAAGEHLLALVITALVATALAVRMFRWD